MENAMNDIFKDDEFTQFVLKKYFVDSDMTDEEKLQYIHSSVEAFDIVTESFNLSRDTIRHAP